VHFFALRSLRVGLTHPRPLRRPGWDRSMTSVTWAASDSRQANFAPFFAPFARAEVGVGF
jgi:hypothetical protein